MAITIHCYEPQSSPRALSLVLDTPQPFAVYSLQDNISEDTRDLRSTILRKARENPPPNSTLLMELDIRASRPGELPTMKVLRVGGTVTIELVRADSRGRVADGNDLKSGTRYEATLRDLRTVVFNIELETDATSSKGSVASARPTGSKAVTGMGSLLWVVPNVAETLTEPRGKIVAFFAGLAKRLGISRSAISAMLLMSPFIIVSILGIYYFFGERSGFTAEIEQLKEDNTNLSAANSAAIAAETECRTERKKLTRKLDDIEEARKLQAEIAIAVPMAHAVAIEIGGARMGDEAAMEFDVPARKAVHKLVTARMGQFREAPNLAETCRSNENALQQDLPPYTLLWHPSSDYLCPDGFSAVLDGVDLAGPWGLSKRVAKEFGGLFDGDADPRMSDRWSAATLTTGVREIMKSVLTADTGERPPVAPGQAHLWSLALFDAYNRMPSPAEGAMDRPAVQCVSEALRELGARFTPAEPGQPVLPPLALVASGEELRVTPTAGCPWPSDAFNKGAASAVRAATMQALVQQAIDEAEDEE